MFAPRIFQMIGVGGSGSGDSLLTTGVYGVVKFVTTIFYVVYLVEHIGRRLPLIVGALIQATCMLYLALYVKFGTNGNLEDNQGGTPAGGIVGAVAIYLYAFGWSFGEFLSLRFAMSPAIDAPGLLATLRSTSIGVFRWEVTLTDSAQATR